jgi:hypothetical protein
MPALNSGAGRYDADANSVRAVNRDIRIGGEQGEAFLDLLLPLSLLGFLGERSGDPAGMIALLDARLVLKFLFRAQRSPLAWILIGVLVVSLAEIFHPATISSPGDLTLVLLAFAAGCGRTDRQWRISFWIIATISVASLFFVEFDRYNKNLEIIPFPSIREWLPIEAVRIQKITINRSGYIFGLLSLIGYGLFRHGGRGFRRWLAFSLALLSYLLAFGTGSRAAAGLPILAILCCELGWFQRQRVSALAWPLTGLILIGGLLFNTALYAPWSPLAYQSRSDVGRANVAQCFLAKSFDTLPELLTGHGDDRISEICHRTAKPTPGYQAAPVHAHNAFLQTLADYGLPAMLMLVALIGLSFLRNLQTFNDANGLVSTVGLSITIFIFCSALVESTLLKTSLQQVLSGYLLAVAWRRGDSRSAATTFVDHVGQHGEHEHVQRGNGQ